MGIKHNLNQNRLNVSLRVFGAQRARTAHLGENIDESTTWTLSRTRNTGFEGFRLFATSLRRKIFGFTRYSGNAQEICEQIVRACFDHRRSYFRTSTTSYAEFWARDFGRCIPALLELGFEREVGDTYRLACYECEGHFSLVLTPSGKPFDFPAYAPDGFAFFLYGLAKLDDPSLVKRY